MFVMCEFIKMFKFIKVNGRRAQGLMRLEENSDLLPRQSLRLISPIIWLAYIMLPFTGLSCSAHVEPLDNQDMTVNRPPGWTEETHGEKADPNYDVIFPAQKVSLLDISISKKDWETMLKDMTEMLGEFGKGQANQTKPPDIPKEALSACQGKHDKDSCSVTVEEKNSTGQCLPIAENLVCVPETEIQACAEKKEGDACTSALNGSTPGVCVLHGTTAVCVNGQKPPQAQANMKLIPRDPVYVPCTIQFEGREWRNVGIRFKGNSSLTHSWEQGTYKISFRIDTDEFENAHPEIKNQRFFGFKELSLASNFLDPSLLREKMTADLFREAGVPAPHTAFYRLYLDHGDGIQYFGLYTMVEVPDTPMLASQFKSKGGNLYKPEGPSAAWTHFDKSAYEKKSNKSKADWRDIQEAVEALNAAQSDRTKWRADLENTFDVYGFLKWLAVNTVMTNWDTYGNGAHNYYLYGIPADGGRLHWIPWDNNMSFGVEGLKPPLPFDMSTVSEEWPLIRKLVDDEVYCQAYLDEVRAFIDGAFKLEPLQARFSAEHALIKSYVVGKDGEQPGYTQLPEPKETVFTSALSTLRAYIAARHEAATEFLNYVKSKEGCLSPTDKTSE